MSFESKLAVARHFDERLDEVVCVDRAPECARNDPATPAYLFVDRALTGEFPRSASVLPAVVQAAFPMLSVGGGWAQEHTELLGLDDDDRLVDVVRQHWRDAFAPILAGDRSQDTKQAIAAHYLVDIWMSVHAVRVPVVLVRDLTGEGGDERLLEIARAIGARPGRLRLWGHGAGWMTLLDPQWHRSAVEVGATRLAVREVAPSMVNDLRFSEAVWLFVTISSEVADAFADDLEVIAAEVRERWPDIQMKQSTMTTLVVAPAAVDAVLDLVRRRLRDALAAALRDER